MKRVRARSGRPEARLGARGDGRVVRDARACWARRENPRRLRSAATPRASCGGSADSRLPAGRSAAAAAPWWSVCPGSAGDRPVPRRAGPPVRRSGPVSPVGPVGGFRPVSSAGSRSVSASCRQTTGSVALSRRSRPVSFLLECGADAEARRPRHKPVFGRKIQQIYRAALVIG